MLHGVVPEIPDNSKKYNGNERGGDEKNKKKGPFSRAFKIEWLAGNRAPPPTPWHGRCSICFSNQPT
jgi:hypothetical protein